MFILFILVICILFIIAFIKLHTIGRIIDNSKKESIRDKFLRNKRLSDYDKLWLYKKMLKFYKFKRKFYGMCGVISKIIGYDCFGFKNLTMMDEIYKRRDTETCFLWRIGDNEIRKKVLREAIKEVEGRLILKS